MSAFLAAPAAGDRARHLSVMGTAWTERFSVTGRSAGPGQRRGRAPSGTGSGRSRPGRPGGSQSQLQRRVAGPVRGHGERPRSGRSGGGGPQCCGTGQGRGEQRVPRRPGEFGQHRALALRRACTPATPAWPAPCWRYLHGGVQADLDDAITAGRTSGIAAAPEDDPARPGLQANLADPIALERFSRQWRLADLTEAVRPTAQTAAAAATSQDPARAVALGPILRGPSQSLACYTATSTTSTSPCRSGPQAVAAAPATGHPGEAPCLSNLGGMLRNGSVSTGGTVALDEAVTVLGMQSASLPRSVKPAGLPEQPWERACAAGSMPAALPLLPRPTRLISGNR